MIMNTELLITHGNTCREQNNPEGALSAYAQALTQDRNSASAFNNYGNVLREIGEPAGAVPFLLRATQLDPSNITAHFNLAVAYLIQGNYSQGWTAYESRWQYEHLNGALPNFSQPRWTGQDLKDKTILVCGEQGYGDIIQFIRFVKDLADKGACVVVQVDNNLAPLFANITQISQLVTAGQAMPAFDYWVPVMSIPGILGTTLETLSYSQYYLTADPVLIKGWADILGAKKKLRVGFCWSGRRDTWINRHKSVPFADMLALVKRNPNYEWINLQCDCSAEQEAELVAAGVTTYPGSIRNFADTAALIHHLDVVLSVDTVIAHLSGALGRPTWVMLNQYGLDWRWLLDRDNSPWYGTASLFRQPSMGDWTSVTNKIHQYLSWYKI